MAVTDSGKTTFSREVHSSKVDSGIESKFSDKIVTVLRLLQNANTVDSNFTNDFGNLNSVRFQQLRNAAAPMLSKDSGRSIDVMLE